MKFLYVVMLSCFLGVAYNVNKAMTLNNRWNACNSIYTQRINLDPNGLTRDIQDYYGLGRNSVLGYNKMLEYNKMFINKCMEIEYAN